MLSSESLKGVENLVAHALAVTPSELVAILHVGVPEIAAAFGAAIEQVGARARITELDAFAARTDVESFSPTAPELDRALEGAAASILLVGGAFTAARSIPLLAAAKRHGTRHLHFLAVEPRVLAQSARADPALLARVNERVTSLFAAAPTLELTAPGGTELRVRLAASYPVLSGHGRPRAGESEGVPSGYVYTHPADVSGTLVVDRAIVGAPVSPQELRRHPVRIELQHGRVAACTCDDASIRERVEAYLASHPNAARVGLVLFPTNHLVRSEIGHRGQDALIPGLAVYLGFTESGVTRASFDANVQLQLFVRRASVSIGKRALVERGRHAADLVEGIDPFR